MPQAGKKWVEKNHQANFLTANGYFIATQVLKMAIRTKKMVAH
jgi:hypothetical protein